MGAGWLLCCLVSPHQSEAQMEKCGHAQRHRRPGEGAQEHKILSCVDLGSRASDRERAQSRSTEFENHMWSGKGGAWGRERRE